MFCHCSKYSFADRVISRLTEFDRLFEHFYDWLNQMEVKVKAVVAPRTTLEDKNKVLEGHQKYLDELAGKRLDFDDLSTKVQQLRPDVVDPHIILQLTQLHSKYLDLETYLKVNTELLPF